MKFLKISALLLSLFVMTSSSFASGNDAVSAPEKKAPRSSWLTLIMPTGTDFKMIGGNSMAVRSGNDFQISVDAENQGTGYVELLDGNHNVIRKISMSLDKGMNSIRLKVRDIRRGLYFMNLHSGAKTESRVFEVR